MGATVLLAGMYLGLADPGAPPDRVPAAGESGAGGLLVLLLALATGMAFFFATPLVMFTSAGPLSALAASLRGALGNLLPLLVFGVIYVVLAVAAAIPYGLGFLVLGPVGAGAAYASFAEVFPPAAESQGRRGETAFPA
ncbi:MAG TPA: hypothetical protein VKA48_10725 [Gammaproteobacteria bacterium]|nr:hypothetical protein [Gammaproteobacteria bacterium]